MIELLLAFSLWPWLMVLGLVVMFSVSTYSETTLWAFLGMVGFFSIGFLAYDVNPFVWVYNNPMKLVTGGVLFGAIGAAWSFFKWRKRILSEDIQYRMVRAKEEYRKLYPDAEPKDYTDSMYFPDQAKASQNKDRIVAWIVLWPLSVIGYFIGEILLEIAEKIYELFSGVYNRITKYYAP